MCNPKIGLSTDGSDYVYPVGLPEKYKKIYKSEILKKQRVREEEPSDFLAASTQSIKKLFFMLMHVWKQFTGTTFYT